MHGRMGRWMIVGGVVVLSVGYGAYKLSQAEVEQIEKITGNNAEDLTDEELEGVMDELGIESQEPADEEIALFEAEVDKNPSV